MIGASNQRSSTQTRAALVGQWLAAVGIAGSALAVGTVHTSILCIVAAVLAVAAAATWWGAEAMTARPAATVLLVVGLGLTAYTALQCVPVPVGWLAVIAPHNADVWSRALAPLHEAGPRWASLSLDPVATRVEVLKGIVYLLAFVAALRIARSREGVGFLSTVMVATGVVLAAAALLHPAFKSRRLFGIYDPGPSIWDRHIAPLMNPNNLAGYLNIALCLALAATLAPRPRIPRAIMGAITLILAATQVWVASRAGVLTMALGVLVVATVVRMQRSPRRTEVAMLSMVTGGAAAIGSILVVLAGSQEASNELFEANVSKLGMFLRVMKMLPAMPLFGCGRGAFESAFPAFNQEPGHVTFTHPENVIAQWVLEWGLPVGVAGLVAVAFALRPTAVVARSATAAGAWAALVALSVQNLGDLGTEVPGLMLAAVACAAIVVAGSHGREPKWAIGRWARAPGRVAGGACVAAALGLCLVSTAFGNDLGEARRSLHDAAMNRPVSAVQMHDLARAAMMRHPAEPYLPFITGLRASYAHDDNPLPWAAAALERAHVYGPAHLVVARTVAPRSLSQARFEYRLTMEQTPLLVGMVMTEAPRVVGSYADATELLPEGKDRAAVVDLIDKAAGNRLPATCIRLDADLASRSPAESGPAIRAARNAVDDVESDDPAPWCLGDNRARCERAALDASERARALLPSNCESYALHARARLAAHDVNGGLTELEDAADRVPARVDCLKRVVALARRSKSIARAEAALDRIVGAGCSDALECAANLRWAAAQAAAMGDSRKALALYRRAYQRVPEDDGLLEQLAQLASACGLHAEAADDFEQLARKHPLDRRFRDAAATEHSAAVKDAVGL
jgi:tetratricopeptide (TPR) repeat protein